MSLASLQVFLPLLLINGSLYSSVCSYSYTATGNWQAEEKKNCTTGSSGLIRAGEFGIALALLAFFSTTVQEGNRFLTGGSTEF